MTGGTFEKTCLAEFEKHWGGGKLLGKNASSSRIKEVKEKRGAKDEM